MAKQHLLVFALVASVLLTAFSASTTPANSSTVYAAATAYDILAKNNLPRGLLPKGVQSYTIQPSDGKMEVTLPGLCDFPVTVGGKVFTMRFGNEVGGIVKPGFIHEAYGVRVQVEFGWLGISAIDRAGDKLTFTIRGSSTMSFPVSNFAVSPSCSH